MIPNHFMERFWTYSFWSLQFLFVMPIVLIIFLAANVSLLLAYRKQRPFQSPLWKRSNWLVLTQLLFYPIVICIGILYPADGPSYLRSVPNSVANRVCDFLFWSSLALAAFWIYRLKRFRWFAVSLIIVLEMILVGAFFVAEMAITGDWL